MKIVIWTIGIIIMLGVLAYVYFTRGTFVAPDQTTVAATAVPTPTPSATPAPTAQPWAPATTRASTAARAA